MVPSPRPATNTVYQNYLKTWAETYIVELTSLYNMLLASGQPVGDYESFVKLVAENSTVGP